jgi:hypothetical protein
MSTTAMAPAFDRGMAFGAQSPTTRFLRQALHSRRLLLLVDDRHLTLFSEAVAADPGTICW